MTMYTSHQNTIDISHYAGCVTRIDVPKIPGIMNSYLWLCTITINAVTAVLLCFWFCFLILVWIGAFVLKNLLSYDECYQIISAAETIGVYICEQ